MVSNNPVALYYPLPYGRRTAPSKKDGKALEGKTHDCFTTTRDGAVTLVQRERSLRHHSPCAAVAAVATPSRSLH
jgi:hypothetical protein